MRTFLIRRLLSSIPLVIIVTFIAKAMLVLSPGDYFTEIQARPGVSPERIAELRQLYHIDSDNVFERYWFWLWPALKGDFGYSFLYHDSVWTVLGERVFNTLLLTGSALLFSWGFAIPLGILAAFYRNRWLDKLAGFVSFFGLSIPSVFFSLLMLMFAVRTRLFPAGGIHDQVNWSSMTGWEQFIDTIHHLILPTIVLGTIGLAQYARQMRSEMIETLSQDYIRTARAKGLGWGRIIWRHALGNAINPLVTLFGFSLASLLAGALLTEYVFGWPGLGTLVYDALQSKDEPLVMAAVTMFVLMLVLGNLVADLLLGLIDPRIRVE